MVNPIPPLVKRVWDRWNIRGLVLFSLFLQTFLILCAPNRKKTARKLIIFFIWTAYLLADWTASFVVGLISNNQSKSDSSEVEEALLAFWAPFLLLHLGGPDTITAFALEDNALWLRHLIGLLFQVIANAYVFIQTISDNEFWIPASLMFLAGVVKYAERTRALYLASLGSFRQSMLKKPDPGPNYAKLMEEYAAKKEAKFPTRIDLTPEPDKESRAVTDMAKEGSLTDLEVIQYAFHYFTNFKGLIVDLIFSFRERNESRDFFLKRTSTDALKVIEVELNLIYEALYTKVVVLHNGWGQFFRLLSFSSVSVALGLFYRLDKTGLRRADVKISYALLLGAIALDFISFFMAIFSDWTVASSTSEDSWVPIPNMLFRIFLILRGQRWSEHKQDPFTGFSKLDTPRMFRRWRESVSQFNLITYCLRTRLERKDIYFKFPDVIFQVCARAAYLLHRLMDIVIDYLGAKEFLDDWWYVSRQPFLEKLWMMIFDEMHKKSKEAETAEATKRICSARGSYVLLKYSIETVGDLTPYFEEVAFDESLILWHLATELCYRSEETKNDNTSHYREFSKLLSDYMLYLLVMLPNLMSSVAGIGEIRFKDTCAETKKFFDRRGLKSDARLVKVACRDILDVNTDVEPVTVKGDRSKSVLFDASILAKKLKKLDQKWEILTKIWIEMLGFAGSHCRPDSHAQQVSKGGELITFVWLLMAHFGLGEQFQINKGHARAKLIVEK